MEQIRKGLSNIEIVTLAVFLLGGNLNYVDTEEIAIKSNDIAPGRFAWRKYPNQINIEVIRKRLSDAKKTEKYGFLYGSVRKGWILTEKGLEVANRLYAEIDKHDLTRIPRSKSESLRARKEKEKMIRSDAFQKFIQGNSDKISVVEAESFFRLDDYIRGNARKERITRIINTFGSDLELAGAIEFLVNKVREI
jgi:hypothetical protein